MQKKKSPFVQKNATPRNPKIPANPTVNLVERDAVLELAADDPEAGEVVVFEEPLLVVPEARVVVPDVPVVPVDVPVIPVDVPVVVAAVSVLNKRSAK